jgi:pimeloyl-ACP methyl ester carboxylesterase
MPEELTDVGRGITICHESFGDPADPPLLLVMGLGMQMVAWPEAFCRELAGHGFHVTRFDNRDAGRSTHMDIASPTLRELATRRFRPEQYTLEDMAEDTAGLIAALALGPVHLVGVSQGGMISQTLATRRPELVRSLASIMSNTGSRITGQPTPKVLRSFLKPPPREREAMIEHWTKFFALIGSEGADPGEVRAIADVALARTANPDPRGTERQLGAQLKSGNRTKQLRRIKAPTVVIHGAIDPLIRPSGGRATAKAIPGAKLITIDRMGHDLPTFAWPRIIDAIVANARVADAADGEQDAMTAAA